MTRNGRIDKLERALQPEEPPLRFTLCQAPEGLTPEAHALWHKDRGEIEFTINLGDCDIREGDDE
jgi:hypothetical protein